MGVGNRQLLNRSMFMKLALWRAPPASTCLEADVRAVIVSASKESIRSLDLRNAVVRRNKAETHR